MDNWRSTTKHVYVGNLPYDWNEEDVRNSLSKAGELLSIRMCKGYAFAEFATREGAEHALSMFHGKSFEGRIVKLDYDAGEKYKITRRKIRRGGNGGMRRGKKKKKSAFFF